MQGLDSTFDAIFFVSYHGSMASESSPLSHTYNPRAIAEVQLNGTVVGESGINALVALGHGVPIVLDHRRRDHRRRRPRKVSPGIRAAVVKTAVSRFAADSLHPAAARELILRPGPGGGRGSWPLPHRRRSRCPRTLEITFRNPDLAEMATWITGVSAHRQHDGPQSPTTTRSGCSAPSSTSSS